MNYYIEFLRNISNDLYDDDEVLIVKKLMENMDHIYDLKLEELAKMTYSSSATIIRFIKRIGFKSYSDFKAKVSVGYERNRLVHEKYFHQDQDIHSIIQYYGNEKKQMIENIYQTIDLSRMIDLVRLVANSHSVTIVGDYHSLEICYLLNLTLIAYNIPCYIFKQREISRGHLEELKENDLVLYILDHPLYSVFIKCNPNVPKAALMVNSCDTDHFKEEEIYQVANTNEDVYTALYMIGRTICNYFPIVIKGEQ